MIDQETTTATRTSAKRWGTAAAFLAAGLAGGVVLAGTVSANAATSSPSPSATSSTTGGDQQPNLDPTKPMRSDETLLTGDTAEKVRAAALAKYPGATVERVETDSDGVYEAHLVTTDGTHVIVAVDTSFAVTGTQEMTGGPGGHGKGGGPGAGETALTGDTADKVTAAALAKYPGATVERVETDSDGVYEAHLVTTDGTHVIVAVDKGFAVTGTQEMPAGGPAGHGPQDGPAPQGGSAPSASPSTTA